MRETRMSAAVLGLVVAAWAAPVRADYIYFPNQPAGTGDNSSQDVDFSTASIPTGTSGALSGKKYWVLNLATYNGQSQCFDIFTRGTTNGDTRIWVYDSTISDYRSLNDDADGSWYSHARIWIVPPSNGGQYVSPVFSSYNSAYNSMLFTVSIVKLPLSTTETDCTSGSTYKSTQTGSSFTNAT